VTSEQASANPATSEAGQVIKSAQGVGRHPDGPNYALLLVLVLVSAAIRVWMLQGDRVVWGDEPFYLWLGRNWITGAGFGFMGHADVHHGPLFPMLSGIVYLTTNDMRIASDILYVVLGAALVWPVYGLGRVIYGKRVAMAAAAVTAVFPALSASVLHWGTMTEPLYMLVLYVGLWLTARSFTGLWDLRRETTDARQRSQPWWVFLLAGLFLGLAYLVRPEAVLYVAVCGGSYVLLAALHGQLRRLRTWRNLVLFAVGFGLCYMPYAYYVFRNTGAWMVSEKVGVAYLTGIGLAKGDTAAFDKATWGLDSTGLETFFFSSESYRVSMLDLIVADLRTFAVVLYLNVRRFVTVLIDWTLFPYALAPLAMLGLFGRAWTRERTLKELFLVATTLPVLSFILFYIQARYIVAMVPVLILWVAQGLVYLGDWLVAVVALIRSGRADGDRPAKAQARQAVPGHRSVLYAAPVVLLMAGLVAIHPYVVDKVTDVGSWRPAHRLVGEALKSQISPSDTMMCRYPAIAFHADAQWVPTPNADLDAVMRYAEHKGVDLFAIDERELGYRPQFADLVRGGPLPDQLELVYVDDDQAEKLVVYRVAHDSAEEHTE